MSNNQTDQRPMILLDVDGVINDLGALSGRTRTWDTTLVRSNGYVLAVPGYMPALVQYLDLIGEVHWCTTWRERANGEIAEHLGVGPFPVVDDGTRDRCVDWKAAAARPVAEKALAEGRRVLWIEDFYGDPPVGEMPAGVEFIDTATDWGDAVLRPEHLPEDLRPSGCGKEAA